MSDTTNAPAQEPAGQVNNTTQTPMIEMKLLICAPGVMVSTNVGITGVNIKDLMAIEGDRLHKDLVNAANAGIEIMAKQYNGVAAPVVDNLAARDALASQQKAA